MLLLLLLSYLLLSLLLSSSYYYYYYYYYYYFLFIFKINYTFALTLFLLNLSDITKAIFRCNESFIMSDCIFAFIIVHANCVLNSTFHPVEAVIINYYYYSTHFLPYLPFMHVEFSLRHGHFPVRLYKYFRNSLANCSFEGWGYSLFSIEYVLLHIFTTISKAFLIISGKIL